jgi:integrase
MAVPGLAANPYVINNGVYYPQQSQHLRTFREAATSYIEHDGEARYLDPIVAYFGDRPLNTIFPFDIKEMAKALFPSALNSTLNRQALSPARAVINHAYERGWCNLVRLRNFREDKPRRKTPASPIWLQLFVRECDRKGNIPHVAAIVLFMAQTGARVSEAIELCWSEVDLAARTALLLRVKTGKNSLRSLSDELVNRLLRLSMDKTGSERVFRYTNRKAVNERIAAVCKRAGISYKPSHTCGRHTFANMALDMGIDIPTAMAAGGWESATVFLGIYVRPRWNASRIAADRFNQIQFDIAV